MSTTPEFPVITSPNIKEALQVGNQQVGESDWLALYTMAYQLDARQPDRIALVDDTEHLTITSFDGKLPNDPNFSYDPKTDLLVRVPHTAEGVKEEEVTMAVANALARERSRRAWQLYRWAGKTAAGIGCAATVSGLLAHQPMLAGVGVGIITGGSMLAALGDDRRRSSRAPEGYATGMVPIPVAPA